jgi:hypothetical protein
MKVDISPWTRERLSDELRATLQAFPDDLRLSVSRGQSGYGATLIRRNPRGYDLLSNVTGHREPEDAISAALEAIRPKPVLVP